LNSEKLLTGDYLKASEDIRTSYLVSASAGTGKTRVLVNRYLNILRQSDAGVDEIIAITFTEKAAAEMKERIRRSSRDVNCSRHRISDQLSSAPISTIHSFCARILQENVGEIGLDPQFRIIDDVEEQILRRESLHRFLHDQMVRSNPEISALMEHFDLSRIRDMLDIVWTKQQDFYGILKNVGQDSAPSLYKKIYDHYRQYTLTLLRNAFHAPEIERACRFLSTYHARDPEDKLQIAKTNALRVVRTIHEGNLPNELMSGSLSKVFSLKGLGQKTNWGPELEEMRSCFRLLNSTWASIKEQIFDFNDPMEKLNSNLIICFAQLAQAWIDNMRAVQNENGVVDFNGLEVLTESFLGSGCAAAQRFSKRFKHLLVDEFQDISPIQDRILTALCKLNPGIVTFFVGDEKQSIYRFRGAEVEIFNRYKQRHNLLYLDENYRSMKALNQFFNRFFSFLMKPDGQAPDYNVIYEKPVKSHDESRIPGVPVQLLITESDRDNEDITTELSNAEAEFVNVVQAIRNLHGREIVKEKDKGMRQADWRDFAILLRSRTHQDSLERILNKAGVPYYVASGVGFYQRREILDIVNFLRTLLNIYDEIALVGTLRSPLVGMSDDDLTAMTTEDGLMDGIAKILDNKADHLTNHPDVLKRFRQFLDMYWRLQEKMVSATTAEVIQAILDETDYLAILAAFPEEKQSIANVRKLVDLAIEWSRPHDISPVDFIRRIQLYQSMEIREGEANLSSEIENSVTIMTIHAAKGLSFPIVVIPELSGKQRSSYDRILSDRNKRMAFNLKTTFNDYRGYLYSYLTEHEKKRAAAEEKRILYVAATRAESYLLLSATERNGTGNPLWSAIKPFFEGPNAGISVYTADIYETIKRYAAFKSRPEREFKHLEPELRNEIEKQIQPLPVCKGIRKVTPTAFASWLSGEKGELPSYEKHRVIEDTIDEKRTLLSLDIGTIIHQAFSWWDFQDVRKLRRYTEELLKPYSLSEAEAKRYLGMFAGWGEKFLQPKNRLAKYIKNAVEQLREVDIYTWLMNTPVEGKIDLLLKMRNDEYIIVDFKSDRIDDYPDEATMIKYDAQLDLYALMLSRGSELTVAKTCLYFIRNGLLIDQECTNTTLRETEEQLQKYIQSV